MSVYLCGDIDPPELEGWLHHVRGALPEERIDTSLERLGAASVDVALVANPPPGSLRGLSGLRLIQSLWAGVDRLLADASLPPDVPLARMVDPSMSAAMAETALWAVLSLHRGFFVYAQQQRAAEWSVLPQRCAWGNWAAQWPRGSRRRATACTAGVVAPVPRSARSPS
jgi:glyoxylate/hydroxypyruvate reductase A